MFGYETIKTSDLIQLKGDLATSRQFSEVLLNKNDALELKLLLITKERDELLRKRGNGGKYAAKVKMFEPFKMIVTPRQSKVVQQTLLAEGERWNDGSSVVKNTKSPFLIFNGESFRATNVASESIHSEHTLISYRQFKRIYQIKNTACQTK